MKQGRTLPRAVLLSPADSGVSVARSLARRGVETHMLIEDEGSWIGATRWAVAHTVGRLPEHAPNWIEKLNELGRAGEGVLISCSDRATDLVARRRAEIPSNLRSFESPASPHLRLMDKASLYGIADEVGVPCPRTLILSDRAEIDRVVSDAVFPCLIKPVHSHLWRSLFGERRTIVVSSADQLRRETAPALEAGVEVIVSEHIPGGDDHLEGAMTVRRDGGAYAVVCGRRKVRMHPPGYGAAAIVESAAVPETIALTETLLDAVDFVGVSSSEFKRHAETGKPYLIEINVRLPQAWGVTDVARVDGSWRLYEALAGLPAGARPIQRTGVRSVIPALELRAAPTHLAEGKLTLRGVLAGYRGVRGVSGLTIRDPMPILTLMLTYLRWLFGHLADRLPLGGRHARSRRRPGDSGSRRATL